jgi:hypothetical protein
MYCYLLTLKQVSQVMFLGLECYGQTQELGVQSKIQVKVEQLLNSLINDEKTVHESDLVGQFHFLYQ